MSGPGRLPLLPTKQDVRTEALRDAAEQLWSSEPRTPDAGLEEYVPSHSDFTLDNIELIEL